jgi:DNA-binding transcriptional LysR family regulator
MGLGATDLNLLIALEALLEEGSVTRAATRLRAQQPTMSGTLSRLRRHYGDELLVRVGRDYELTAFAKSLLPAVQETMRLMREAFGIDAEFDAVTSDRTFSVMCSDYAMTVLYEPLQRRVRSAAPGVRLELSGLPGDMLASDRGLLRQDFVIGPLGYAFPGEHELLFRDSFVCIVDARNSRLRDATLNMRDLAEMPHAVATFPGVNITPVDRFFGELGLRRRVLVRTNGFLPLPFAVRGTDSVAVIPEQMARRFAGDDRWAIVEPPFGQVDILEGLWWHPSRAADPGHRWLLSQLRDVAAELSAGEPRASAPAMHGVVREDLIALADRSD